MAGGKREAEAVAAGQTCRWRPASPQRSGLPPTWSLSSLPGTERETLTHRDFPYKCAFPLQKATSLLSELLLCPQFPQIILMSIRHILLPKDQSIWTIKRNDLLLNDYLPCYFFTTDSL